MRLYCNRFMAAVFGLGLLAGCADQPIGTFDSASYRMQALPSATHMLSFVPDAPDLAAGEAGRLADFLGPLALAGSQDLLLTYVPSGSPKLDLRRVRVATDTVRAAGWPSRIHVVESRDLDRTDRRSDLVLVEPLSRGQLLVACPRQRADAFEERYTTPLPPLGCANATNLAHMTAQTSDLVSPRELGPSDGAVSAAAVLRHRTGQVIQPPSLRTKR